MPVTGESTQEYTATDRLYDVENDEQECSPAANASEKTIPNSGALRLLVIPFLIYLVWVLDTFLLEGSMGVISRYQPLPLFLYTIVANILIGIIVPVVCLRPAFLSGAINMFQIGFRSLRRILAAVLFTVLFCYLLLVTFTHYGSGRLSLCWTFALMLPLAIAGVMVCWVLLGTHIQAYVRTHGAFVSILAGVAATGILFGVSSAALSAHPVGIPGYMPLFCAGFISAIFFFSVRDVYASAVFLAFLLTVIIGGQADSGYTMQFSPVVIACAVLSLLTLASCHLYLSRKFITIKIPVRSPNKRH